MRLALALAIVALVGWGEKGWASGTLYYGSRTGMFVDVVAMSGLDTTHAVIHTRHTRANAIAFCRDYAGKVTETCIREELGVRLNDDVTANCNTGEFVDFDGHRYRFEGKSKDKDASAAYRIVDLETGDAADGSSASGYSTNAGIFGALCPRHAPADPEFHF